MHIRQLLLVLCFWPLALSALAEGEVKASSSALAWAEAYDNSEWVLRLRVEGVGQLVNPAMSRNRLMAIQGYRYSASVLQSWKGNLHGTIRFQVELNDCAQILQVDQEYVVFGATDYHGVLESDSCDKIIALDEADSLLPQLDTRLSGS